MLSVLLSCALRGFAYGTAVVAVLAPNELGAGSPVETGLHSFRPFRVVGRNRSARARRMTDATGRSSTSARRLICSYSSRLSRRCTICQSLMLTPALGHA